MTKINIVNPCKECGNPIDIYQKACNGKYYKKEKSYICTTKNENYNPLSFEDAENLNDTNLMDYILKMRGQGQFINLINYKHGNNNIT